MPVDLCWEIFLFRKSTQPKEGCEESTLNNLLTCLRVAIVTTQYNIALCICLFGVLLLGSVHFAGTFCSYNTMDPQTLPTKPVKAKGGNQRFGAEG